MKRFIKSEGFSLEHKNGFTLNTKGKIIFTKIMVQIMPSIEQGLQYIFFLKKLMPLRKILGIKNNKSIAYSSQSFDDAFEIKITQQSVVSYFTEEIIHEIRKKKEIRLIIEEQEFFITFLHEFIYKDIAYLFVQFCEESDIFEQTQYNLLGDLIQNKSSKQNDINFLNKIDKKEDLIMSESSDFIEKMKKQGLNKIMVRDKSVSDKMKKYADIRNLYSIVIDS